MVGCILKDILKINMWECGIDYGFAAPSCRQSCQRKQVNPLPRRQITFRNNLHYMDVVPRNKKIGGKFWIYSKGHWTILHCTRCWTQILCSLYLEFSSRFMRWATHPSELLERQSRRRGANPIRTLQASARLDWRLRFCIFPGDLFHAS